MFFKKNPTKVIQYAIAQFESLAVALENAANAHRQERVENHAQIERLHCRNADLQNEYMRAENVASKLRSLIS